MEKGKKILKNNKKICRVSPVNKVCVAVVIIMIMAMVCGCQPMGSNAFEVWTKEDKQKSLIEAASARNVEYEMKIEDIVLPQNINAEDVVQIYDKYLVIDDGGRQVIATNGAILDLKSCDFNKVLKIIDDYALVQKNGNAPKIVNLKTKQVIVSNVVYDVEEDEYYKISVVNNFAVFVHKQEEYLCDDYFDLVVYDLRTGGAVLSFIADVLNEDDIAVSYFLNEKTLIVNTLSRNYVYKLEHERVQYGNLLDVCSSEAGASYFESAFVNSCDYDYIFKIDEQYCRFKCVRQEIWHYISANKIFVEKLNYVTQTDGYNKTQRVDCYDAELEDYVVKYRNIKQCCFTFNLNSIDEEIAFGDDENFYYVLDGALAGHFAVVEDAGIYIDAGKYICEQIIIIRYYKATNLTEVISYDYSKYGRIVGFNSDIFICSITERDRKILNMATYSGESVLMDVDKNITKLNGKETFYLLYSKAFGDKFIYFTTNGMGLGNVRGESLLNANKLFISPIINDCVVYKDELENIWAYNIKTASAKMLLELNETLKDVVFETGLDYIFVANGANVNLVRIENIDEVIVENISDYKVIVDEDSYKIVYKNPADGVAKKIVFEQK